MTAQRSDVRRRCARGFSLLEVIVATGVLAASAMLLSSLISSGALYANRAEEQAEAMMLCRNRLAEVRLGLTDVSASEEVDVCPESERWSYRRVVEQLDNPRLARVTVEIFPAEESSSGQAASTPQGRDASQRPAARLVEWIRVTPQEASTTFE